LVTCISFGMTALLLLLPSVLEAKILPGFKQKHFRLNPRTNQTSDNATTSAGEKSLSNGSKLEAFYNHCEPIYREEHFDAHFIRGMIGAIMDRLHELCVFKSIHPLVLMTFTETLYCGGSLAEGIDHIEEILFGKLDKSCTERNGFNAYFVTTSMDHTHHET
ncbi:hypothetical protein KR067_002903, partial [Drosophila pandora]